MALAFPAARMVRVEGAELAVHALGEGPAVVLLHGFPDLGFSFRHQLPALASAGLRAIAPDLRGAGGSRGPAGDEAHSLEALAKDVVGLLDALGLEPAVLVGHDVGALVAYEVALAHRARVAAVVGLVMPHAAAPPVPPTVLWRAALGERFYRLALLADDAEERLARDLDRTLRYFYRRADALEAGARLPFDVPGLALLDELEADEARWALPSLLTLEEHARYRDAYARTGFGAALGWFRSVDRDWARRRLRDERIEAPALLVTAGNSALVPAAHTAGMESLCASLDRAHIERAGYFVHQERPTEVNRILVDWIRGKLGGAS